MLPFFAFMDPLYLLILVIGLVLSGGAALLVKSRFARGQQVALRSGLSGAEVAARILRDAGIHDVDIVEHRGFLSDHYNPLKKTLALSSAVYRGRNAAAAGVAAHEVGHAIQHAESYALLMLRSALVPIAGIGSNLGLWLVIIGMLMGSAQQAAADNPGFAYYMALGGVVLFGAAALFAVVTVPVEFDASSRAKRRLAHLGIVGHGEESAAVSGVLTAAGLTYVAAAVTALLQLLYWAFRAGLVGGRD